jgi:large subunit ribosomal protein L21
MFAVLKTGGKQYKVAHNDVIRVEKLAGEAGNSIELAEVLMIGDESGVKVGTPHVAGTTVTAEIVEQTRGDKIIVFKKRRRHRYRRKNGHRQDITVLRITDIAGVAAPAKVAKTAAPVEAAVEAAAEAPVTPAKKPAAKKAAKPKVEE